MFMKTCLMIVKARGIDSSNEDLVRLCGVHPSITVQLFCEMEPSIGRKKEERKSYLKQMLLHVDAGDCKNGESRTKRGIFDGLMG